MLTLTLLYAVKTGRALTAMQLRAAQLFQQDDKDTLLKK